MCYGQYPENIVFLNTGTQESTQVKGEDVWKAINHPLQLQIVYYLM